MINRYQGKPMEALVRLADVAQGNSGQCHHVRRFLLGLYNSEAWPFELNRLRALDLELKMACLIVLELDAVSPARDIHEYLENGGALFSRFWELESAAG
ncbi:DUF7673 family protein [Salinicola salarius]|uniref:DUF7673 family protein n=1 Tax=Salinicola salarius TaxID=430457 RepID=UPI000DA25E41|nr:hypothetical protein [Salinicola salarius]